MEKGIIVELARYDARGQSRDTGMPALHTVLAISEAEADELWAEYERLPNEKVCEAVRVCLDEDEAAKILRYVEQ